MPVNSIYIKFGNAKTARLAGNLFDRTAQQERKRKLFDRAEISYRINTIYEYEVKTNSHIYRLSTSVLFPLLWVHFRNFVGCRWIIPLAVSVFTNNEWTLFETNWRASNYLYTFQLLSVCKDCILFTKFLDEFWTWRQQLLQLPGLGRKSGGKGSIESLPIRPFVIILEMFNFLVLYICTYFYFH